MAPVLFKLMSVSLSIATSALSLLYQNCWKYPRSHIRCISIAASTLGLTSDASVLLQVPLVICVSTQYNFSCPKSPIRSVSTYLLLQVAPIRSVSIVASSHYGKKVMQHWCPYLHMYTQCNEVYKAVFVLFNLWSKTSREY